MKAKSFILLFFVLLSILGTVGCGERPVGKLTLDDSYMVMHGKSVIATPREFCRDAGNTLLVWLDAGCSACMLQLSEWEKFAGEYASLLTPVYIVNSRHIQLFNITVADMGFDPLFVIHDYGFNTLESNKAVPGAAVIVDENMNIVARSGSEQEIPRLRSVYGKYLKKSRKE